MSKEAAFYIASAIVYTILLVFILTGLTSCAELNTVARECLKDPARCN